MLIYFLFILAKKTMFLLKKLDSFAIICGIKQGKYNA